MEQHIPQDEIRRTIINDMVKKKNSIVPDIGEDAIVYSLCIPLVLLGLPYGVLKWICNAFGKGLKAILRYALLTDISALDYETGFVARSRGVYIGFISQSVNVTFSPPLK